MAKDALAAHVRDELGISQATRARPLQAAVASAFSFTLGAALPLFSAWLSSESALIAVVALSSLTFLCALGALAAYMGGANVLRGVFRVTFWGALAMTVTAGVGHLFGAI